MTPVGSLDCSAWHAAKSSHQQKNQYTKLLPCSSVEVLRITVIGSTTEAHQKCSFIEF